ncbi:MAG TPA: redoxin domain-containing protein [bacterium]
MSEIIRIGQDIPDFEIETYEPAKGDFGKVTLSGIKAKKQWLALVFYPADFTFVCPTELEDVAGKYDAIKKMGGEVVSVSTDTKYSHLAWQQSEGLLKDVKYPMGADPTGRVSRLFGVYDEATGLALRGTFIVNPEGRLVGSEINFYNVGRNADELVRKLKAFIYVSKHPREVCPAKWDEGKKTLTPSAKIVGKILDAVK